MLPTLVPSVTLVRLLQFTNAPVPRLGDVVGDGHAGQAAAIGERVGSDGHDAAGEVTLVRPVHPWKAPSPPELSPMVVRAEGSVTLVRLMQPSNVASPMTVTPLPMVTLARLVQSSKAASPRLVTVSGRVMPVSPVQKMNACAPMLTQLAGMTTLASCVQEANAPGPMLVTPLGNREGAGRALRTENQRVRKS